MNEGTKREHVGSIVGIGIGLLLMPLLVLAVWQTKAASIDGEALVGELFEGNPLPYGLQVAEAATVPGGDRFVILESAVPEEELLGTAREAEPNQVVIVYYKSAKAVNDAFAKRSESVFGGGSSRRRGMMGGGGDHGEGGGDSATVIESGSLEWAVWRANYVHTRRTIQEPGEDEHEGELGDEPGDSNPTEPSSEEAEPGPAASLPPKLGPTRDMIRVNLSAGSKYCVLYASWPLNVQASTQGMQELLEGMGYRPPVEPVATAAG